ncbi:MAG: chalcone isomerase family protein [Rhodanobacteraceae bacterium]|nr:chalcone isomerase family protein [Rhodanobacteraceae bacterium]
MRTLYGFVLLLLLAVPNANAVTVAGHEFADRINVPGVGNNLRLSGVAVLDRNFVPFYAAALYLPTSVRNLEQLQSGLSPYRMVIVWQIPLLAEPQVEEYWRKAFADAAGPERLGRIKLGVERFVELFGVAQHGQTILFDYVPDAGMRVFIDNKPIGQLAGVEFNTALLSIWLGDKAPRDFRTALSAGLAHN